jgi:hypothetical protein
MSMCRACNRKAGYRYDISILQAEFSTTQVLDRPVHGRVFFEQVIRENLDLGRPEEIKLIFNRRMPRRRRSRERYYTRVVTHDVTPSLNIHYKNSRIKQYHKENRALRTETTVNNTYDFGVAKRLHNLPKLREIGLQRSLVSDPTQPRPMIWPGFLSAPRLSSEWRLSPKCATIENGQKGTPKASHVGRRRGQRSRPLGRGRWGTSRAVALDV